MTETERQKWDELMSEVVELNEKHDELVRQSQELVRQNVVFGEELAEQSKRISDLYIKVDNHLNNTLTNGD